MKRIHLYFSPKRDSDLINLMMNPQVNFNKLAKAAIINYINGTVFFIDVPPKTSYEIEPKKKYECTISLREDEEYIADILQTVEDGLRGTCVKQMIRYSIRGSLINYYIQSDVGGQEINRQPTPIRTIQKDKIKQSEKPKEKKIEQVEPKKEPEAIVPPRSNFDLFGELAAMGAGPH